MTAKRLIVSAVLMGIFTMASGQYKTGEAPRPQADTSKVVITLDDALKIALSENVAVKVADKEIERSQYAKKGTYSSLFPQVSGSGFCGF